MTQQNLNKMKTGEVAQQARKSGIKSVENLNKEQLIQAMGGKAPAAKKPSRSGGHRPAPPQSLQQ